MKRIYKGIDEYTNKVQQDCYLTTACIEYKGLEDTCEELRILRNFRDNYMTTFDEGIIDIEHYYNIAPKIIQTIEKMSESQRRSVYEYVYDVIEECITLIKADKNADAYIEYKLMVEKLIKRYLRQ